MTDTVNHEGAPIPDGDKELLNNFYEAVDGAYDASPHGEGLVGALIHASRAAYWVSKGKEPDEAVALAIGDVGHYGVPRKYELIKIEDHQQLKNRISELETQLKNAAHVEKPQIKRVPGFEDGGRLWMMVIWGISAANADDFRPNDLTNGDLETARDLMITRFKITKEFADGLLAQAIAYGILTRTD